MQTPTQKVQAALAERISGFPLITATPSATPWPFGELTAPQRTQRAAFEAAYRAGRLVRPVAVVEVQA